MQPTPDKAKAIVNARAPANQSELKAFVGLITYYSRFVARRADAMAPLYERLQRDARWEWGLNQERRWRSVKKSLSDSAMLVFLDPRKHLLLTGDPSSKLISLVWPLLDENGKDMPILFASGRLSPSDGRCSHIEKQGLAVILGVTSYHQFLFV